VTGLLTWPAEPQSSALRPATMCLALLSLVRLHRIQATARFTVRHMRHCPCATCVRSIFGFAICSLCLCRHDRLCFSSQWPDTDCPCGWHSLARCSVHLPPCNCITQGTRCGETCTVCRANTLGWTRSQNRMPKLCAPARARATPIGDVKASGLSDCRTRTALGLVQLPGLLQWPHMLRR